MSNSPAVTIEMTLGVFPRITRYPIDFALPETQIRMVRNKPKYHAFSEAMAQCVPGKRVLEIGTGSGVLALMAVAHGATKVVAVDRAAVTPMTRAVLGNYPRSREIDLIEGDVFDLDLPLGKFDVILSETIGYLGFEENILPILAYAREHFGSRHATVIPEDMAVMLEPVHLESKLPHEAPHLSLTLGRTHSFERVTASKPVRFGSTAEMEIIQETWKALRAANVDAIAVYFDSRLSAQTRITNLENPNWPHCIIPLENPVRVGAGDTVVCRMKLTDSGHESYKAEISVKDSAGLRRSTSSFDSPEICIETLPPVANSLDALRKEVEGTLRSLNLFDRLA